MKNRGSAVVEMSLIMPILFGIFVLVLTLFLDTAEDSLTCREGYSLLYAYDENGLPDMRKNNQTILEYENPKEAAYEEGVGMVMDHQYRYEKRGHTFMMETGVCSSRLRRWQFYGDIIFE